MNDFEKEVIKRLTRLEIKIDNGMGARLEKIETWIDGRKITLAKVAGVCAVIFLAFEVLEIVGRTQGWW